MIATAFGPHRIFDAHTHFFTQGFLANLGKVAGLQPDAAIVALRLGWEVPPKEPAEVGRVWLTEFDKYGVDRAIAIHTLPGDLETAGAGIAATAGRLTGYVTIDPASPTAVTTLGRAIALGFRGLALFPGMFRFSMTSDAAYVLLQMANTHRMNVMVHCGVLKVSFRNKLGLPAAFDGSLSNPLSLQRPCAEFPQAKFIVPHLGSGLFRELLMLADQQSNVYADTSGIGGWAKYLDGAPSKAQVLRQAIGVLGADRILFGTDSTFFPRGWRKDVFDEHLRVFEEAKLDETEVGKILGGNMEAMIGSGRAA